MDILKFELSVVFTKTGLSPSSQIEAISIEYENIFKKQVNEKDLRNIVGQIIDDQFEMYNYFIQEIPEDYELI